VRAAMPSVWGSISTLIALCLQRCGCTRLEILIVSSVCFGCVIDQVAVFDECIVIIVVVIVIIVVVIVIIVVVIVVIITTSIV
jgi:hypothetical protein